MAGLITVTNSSMTKEVPVELDPSPVTATVDGYKSATDISFAYVAAACTITGTGFTAAGFDGSDDQVILVESTSKVNDGIYTIASDTDTVITLSATDVLITETAAAAGTVKLTCIGIFKIKPTRATAKLLIFYTEGVEAAGELGMIPCILNGDYWVAKNTLYTQFTATVATPAYCVLFVETAPYLQDDGYLYFFLKPIVTSHDLYTDHRPAATLIELP